VRATTCYLQGFSFYLGDGSRGADVRLRAYGSTSAPPRAHRPALFRSDEFAGSGNIFGLDPLAVHDAEPRALVRGFRYALVLSASEPFASARGEQRARRATLTDEYAAGALYGASTGADFAALGRPAPSPPSPARPTCRSRRTSRRC
jgi:hypothetical protein